MLMDSLALKPFVLANEFENLLEECSYPLDRGVMAGVYKEYRIERAQLACAASDYDAHRSALRRWVAVYGVRLILEQKEQNGQQEQKQQNVQKEQNSNQTK